MTSLPEDSTLQRIADRPSFSDDGSGWPPRQRELLKWFRNNAEPLADAYEGAVHLLNDTRFPARVHFIAHAIRDISDRLVFVLDPQLKGSRVQYENEMDKIAEDWPKLEVFDEDNSNTFDETDSVAIDYAVALRINLLVKAHRARRKRPSNYELLFRYLMRHEPSRGEVNKRLVSDFKETRGWFMDLTHLRASGTAQIDEAELHKKFNSFEGMLHSFVGDFFTGTKELDDILRQANG